MTVSDMAFPRPGSDAGRRRRGRYRAARGAGSLSAAPAGIAGSCAGCASCCRSPAHRDRRVVFVADAASRCPAIVDLSRGAPQRHAATPSSWTIRSSPGSTRTAANIRSQADRAVQALTSPDQVRLEAIEATRDRRRPGRRHHHRRRPATTTTPTSTLNLHGGIVVNSAEGYALRMQRRRHRFQGRHAGLAQSRDDRLSGQRDHRRQRFDVTEGGKRHRLRRRRPHDPDAAEARSGRRAAPDARNRSHMRSQIFSSRGIARRSCAGGARCRGAGFRRRLLRLRHRLRRADPDRGGQARSARSGEARDLQRQRPRPAGRHGPRGAGAAVFYTGEADGARARPAPQFRASRPAPASRCAPATRRRAATRPCSTWRRTSSR